MISCKDTLVSVATVLAILLSSSSVNAISLEKRSESQCGLLGDSIYCFGGYITDSLFDNQLYVLPVKNLPASNNSIESIAQSWSLVHHSNSEYTLERRRKATSTTYGNALFITGGYSYGTTVLVNQTIAYDRDSNTWRTFNNYITPGGFVRQVYSATAISLTPVENTIALFGGCTQNTLLSGLAPVQIDNKNHTIIHEGFSSINTFDYTQNLWTEKSPQINLPINFYSGQTATFNPRTGLIYYLGGVYFSSPDYTITYSQDYNTANMFNTTSGNWHLVQLQGNAPAPRISPTATLLPNSNHILLFGGSETGQLAAYPDFCYTLDLDTNNWTLQSIDTHGETSALRFAHSAVLVDTSLFILFGLAVYGRPLNDILVLSVNDVNNLYFTETFPYTEIVKPATVTPNTTDNGTTISASNISPTVNILSTGAIAGIAVSCIVIGLALSAAFLYFFCIRKKKQPKKNIDELSVDWDQVENFYNNVNEPHEQNMIEDEKYLSIIKPGEKTLQTFSSSSIATSSGRYTPNVYDDDSIPKDSKTLNSNSTSNLAEEQVKLMKPSMINEENDTKYVTSSPKPIAMRLKPDIDITRKLEPDI